LRLAVIGLFLISHLRLPVIGGDSIPDQPVVIAHFSRINQYLCRRHTSFSMVQTVIIQVKKSRNLSHT